MFGQKPIKIIIDDNNNRFIKIPNGLHDTEKLLDIVLNNKTNGFSKFFNSYIHMSDNNYDDANRKTMINKIEISDKELEIPKYTMLDGIYDTQNFIDFIRCNNIKNIHVESIKNNIDSDIMSSNVNTITFGSPNFITNSNNNGFSMLNPFNNTNSNSINGFSMLNPSQNYPYNYSCDYSFGNLTPINNVNNLPFGFATPKISSRNKELTEEQIKLCTMAPKKVNKRDNDYLTKEEANKIFIDLMENYKNYSNNKKLKVNDDNSNHKNSDNDGNNKKFKFSFNIDKKYAKLIENANDNNKTGILDIRINGIKNDLYNYDIYINSKTQKMAILTIAHKLLEFGIDENYIDTIINDTKKIIKSSSSSQK